MTMVRGKERIYLVCMQPYLPVSGRAGKSGFRAAGPASRRPPHGPGHGRGRSAGYSEFVVDELVDRTMAVARALR